MASNIQPIKVAYIMGGWGDQPQQLWPEGASQSFKIGAPLSFSSGKLIITANVLTPSIAGIALSNASGTSTTEATANIQTVVPLASVVFAVSCDTTTTSGTAALGTGKPTDFNVGGTYQLLEDSTSGNYYVGTGTSNAVFQIVGYDPTLASTINGPVYARILTSVTIWT